MLLIENSGDLRHHVGDQEAHDQRADAHHDDRISQRAAHLGDEFGLAFAVLGKPVKHRLQRARRLARADHADVEIGENVGMGRERVGQRGAFTHALAHLRQRPLSPPGSFGLVGQRAERIDQLYAGAEQRA